MFVASTAVSATTSSSMRKSLLCVELLDDRLDHEVAADEVVEVGGRRQPGERRLALLGGQSALLDAAAEVVGDLLARALAELVAHLAADRFDPRLRADLCDPGAHGAEAHDAHLPNVRSTHPAGLSPVRTHVLE